MRLARTVARRAFAPMFGHLRTICDGKSVGPQFLQDPNDEENREKTGIVVAGSETDARKALPGYFEVYEVEVRTEDLGGLPGVIGWLGKARN